MSIVAPSDIASTEIPNGYSSSRGTFNPSNFACNSPTIKTKQKRKRNCKNKMKNMLINKKLCEKIESELKVEFKTINSKRKLLCSEGKCGGGDAPKPIDAASNEKIVRHFKTERHKKWYDQALIKVLQDLNDEKRSKNMDVDQQTAFPPNIRSDHLRHKLPLNELFPPNIYQQTTLQQDAGVFAPSPPQYQPQSAQFITNIPQQDAAVFASSRPQYQPQSAQMLTQIVSQLQSGQSASEILSQLPQQFIVQNTQHAQLQNTHYKPSVTQPFSQQFITQNNPQFQPQSAQFIDNISANIGTRNNKFKPHQISDDMSGKNLYYQHICAGNNDFNSKSSEELRLEDIMQLQQHDSRVFDPSQIEYDQEEGAPPIPMEYDQEEGASQMQMDYDQEQDLTQILCEENVEMVVSHISNEEQIVPPLPRMRMRLCERL